MNFKYVIPAVLIGGAASVYAIAYAGSDHDHDHGTQSRDEAHGHDEGHGDDHGHDDGDHADGEHGHQDAREHDAEHHEYESTAAAWEALNAAVAKAESAVGGEPDIDMHGIEEELKASIHYLEDHAPVDDAEKQTRIEAALNQLSQAVGQFHEATHDGFGPAAERELKKIKGGVRLLEGLYPSEILSQD
ncbi:hypothetical protein ACSHT0_16305 [Tepidicaulis sp. LMO-SS28]|uniref:hypothetical protein n=1 Tax=Tepidicaulis sp. LMO-SS28 TaxID=3447455 RepID=UPI003EE10AC8